MWTRKSLALTLSACTLVMSLASAADAGGVAGLARNGLGSARPMREGPNVLAPFAFIRYCVKMPATCVSGAAETLEWSADTKAVVAKVNRSVNQRIRPVNERGDTWSSNVGSGDCEDFALTKRHELLKAGLPTSALRMAVATTASGEGHAVLIVKTTQGDFVLDNRNNQLLPWHDTDLRFIKIATTDPRLWRRVV